MLTRRYALRTALLGIAGGLLSRPGQGQAPEAPLNDATVFLKWSMTRYAALKSLRMEISEKSAYEGYEGRIGSSEKWSLSFAAPNLYRILQYSGNGKSTTYHVCDGSRAIYISRTGKRIDLAYRQSPPKSFAEYAPRGLYGSKVLVAFFGGPDTLTALLSGDKKKRSRPPRFGPDRTIESTPCKTVLFDGGERSPLIEVAIGLRDGLIRQIQYIQPGRPLTETEKRTVEQYSGNRAMAEQYLGPLPEKIEAIPTYRTTQNVTLKLVDAPIPDSEFGTHFEGVPPFAELGEPAPDTTLQEIDGTRTLHLSELRGKVILLCFWQYAPDNRYREYLAEPLRLHREKASQGLSVLAVTDQARSENWKKQRLASFQVSKLTELPTYTAVDNEAQMLYVGWRAPLYILIGRDGKYLIRLEGPQTLEALRTALQQAGIS